MISDTNNFGPTTGPCDAVGSNGALQSAGGNGGLDKLNVTPHLNRARVRRTALEIAKLIRPANKFSRVGSSFLERIEAATRAAIRSEIHKHPSVGKTLL